MSANEPLVHFGLGSEGRLRRLTVQWPSAVRQTFENIPADRIYTITEASEPGEAKRSTARSPAPLR